VTELLKIEPVRPETSKMQINRIS